MHERLALAIPGWLLMDKTIPYLLGRRFVRRTGILKATVQPVEQQWGNKHIVPEPVQAELTPQSRVNATTLQNHDPFCH
jgi:hypothetical protein